MIDWEDSAIILGHRKHGEHDLIVSALTQYHGRHSGLVKGGASRRKRGVLEPGTLVSVRWHARLEDHLGNYTCELQHAVMPEVLTSPGRLAALVSLCGVLETALPEREPHSELYSLCVGVIRGLIADDWAGYYADFERGLLETLGFGLYLDTCVATGSADDLCYVSPKSGCAVSAAAGKPYHGKLLPFPDVFRRVEVAEATDVVAGLAVTGYFLRQRIFGPLGAPFPEARDRLIQRLTRGLPSNGSQSD